MSLTSPQNTTPIDERQSLYAKIKTPKSIRKQSNPVPGATIVSEVIERPGIHVFENPKETVGEPAMYFLGGIGLIVCGIGGLVVAISSRGGQLWLHLTTTAPILLADGMLARGFSLRNLPKRIVVGPDAIEVTNRAGTKSYPWSEIGSAASVNLLNSHQSCLKISDVSGKTIIQIDESFPDYKRLVELVLSGVDAKPDDTSTRIMSRKAKRMGIMTFVFGSFMAFAAIFIANETYQNQRAAQLLSKQGVPGEAELVRRFTAPNGVTRRIEFRTAGTEKLHNVEVEPIYWNQLENAKTVPVLYVPDEPNIICLFSGEMTEDDFL